VLTLSEKSEALLYDIDEFLGLKLKGKNLCTRILYNMVQNIFGTKEINKMSKSVPVTHNLY